MSNTGQHHYIARRAQFDAAAGLGHPLTTGILSDLSQANGPSAGGDRAGAILGNVAMGGQRGVRR
jgi:hypothetical protein